MLWMFTYLNRLRVYEFIIKETWGFKKKINCGFIWNNLCEVLGLLDSLTFNFLLRLAILNFTWKRVILSGEKNSRIYVAQHQ